MKASRKPLSLNRRTKTIQGKRLNHVLNERTKTARSNNRKESIQNRSYHEGLRLNTSQAKRQGFDCTNNRIFNNSSTHYYSYSDKESKKRSINYMNYSKIDHDIITNKPVETPYSNFRDKLLKFEPQKFQDTRKPRVLNRKPRPVNIMKNINYVANLSKLNSLKKESERKNSSMTFTKKNADLKNDGKYVFFKRKSTNVSRRFNELNYSSQKGRKKYNGSSSRTESYVRSNASQSACSVRSYKSSSAVKRLKRNLTVDSTLKNGKNNNIIVEKDNTETIDQIFQSLELKIAENFKGDEHDKAIKRLELLKKYITKSNADVIEILKKRLMSQLLINKKDSNPFLKTSSDSKACYFLNILGSEGTNTTRPPKRNTKRLQQNLRMFEPPRPCFTLPTRRCRNVCNRTLNNLPSPNSKSCSSPVP
ncbi:unnamed protein product [Moneuplotes crassus]|uniref:Uncharacterized protein n=1 Tax=Euplotes crassus TaxID=5936 RepID=A0AAD1UDP2_EUPCR|nr:unnamed protein product [Moneuplotes crassus]